MSKEDKHIDNLFKEKLDGRSFDGPPADFLADLNQRLDNKAAVSRGWIWILFLNLFFIGLFIVNATVDFSTTRSAEVKTQIEKGQQHSEKGKFPKSENSKSKNNLANTNDAATTSEAERFSNTVVKSDETEMNQAKSNGGEKNQTNSDSKNPNVRADVNLKKQSDEATKSENSKDSTGNSSTESNNASNSTSDTNSKVSNQTSTETNNARTTQDNQGVAENKEEASTAKPMSDKKGTSNGTQSLSSYVSYSEIYAPEFEEVDRKIKNNDFPEFPNPWNDLVAEDNNDTSNETPQQKDDDKRMFEIQLQGGATRWGFNTLGTNENYVAELDQSGTPKWTPSFGLAFHANFKNISIGTGIDYAKFKTENLFQFGEVTSYDSTYIGGYNENVTYDSLGNPIDTTYTPYYDSTTVTDTTYNTTLITNQYEWIQIPLHIGYRFNLNKWAIIPRVGMNIGLGIRQTSGQYPNEAYDDLQTIDPVKWQINLHTSLEVRREFGRWHAFGKFNYQRNLTPTIDNALFERKYNGIGFNFGVGYSF